MKKAPFTDEEVLKINEYQVSGAMHPFTCTSGSHTLVANNDGLYCPECPDYKQDWVHDSMADGTMVDAMVAWRKKHNLTPFKQQAAAASDQVEITEGEYNAIGFERRAEYVKIFQASINLNVTDQMLFVDVPVDKYNGYNRPYRRIIYRLKKYVPDFYIDRRACTWLFTPAEKTIYEAIGLIEQMGADVLLTDAQCLLMEAQLKVADYIDKKLQTPINLPGKHSSTTMQIPGNFNPCIDEDLLIESMKTVTLKGMPKSPLEKDIDAQLKTGSF